MCGCTCTHPNSTVSVNKPKSLFLMPFSTSRRSFTQSVLRQCTMWSRALRKATWPSTLNTKVGIHPRRASVQSHSFWLCCLTSVSTVKYPKPIREGMILFMITSSKSFCQVDPVRDKLSLDNCRSLMGSDRERLDFSHSCTNHGKIWLN